MKYSITYTHTNDEEQEKSPSIDMICTKEELVQLEMQTRVDGSKVLYINIDGITILRLAASEIIEN